MKEKNNKKEIFFKEFETLVIKINFGAMRQELRDTLDRAKAPPSMKKIFLKNFEIMKREIIARWDKTKEEWERTKIQKKR